MTHTGIPYCPLWLRLFLSFGLSNRLVLFILSLALSGGMAAGYSALMAPLTSFQSIASRNDEFDNYQPPPPQLANMAHRYLPKSPWTADARYQFRTADACVYASEWKPIDKDRAVLFSPFAMIYLPDDSEPDQQPVTIISQSAILRFQGRFDIESNPGRIIGGTLRGDVRITGPDQLQIEGRSFDFSEQAARIWSDHPVTFQYEDHSGSARGIQIDLLVDSETPTNETISVIGLQKITLRQDVLLDLASEGQPNSTGLSDPVRIRTAGSFEYLIANRLAIFTDDVQVFRPTDEDQTDSLYCDQLTMEFVPGESAESQPSDPEERQFIGLENDLEFHRLLARGRDVTLISEENQLTAHMTELSYDSSNRVVTLSDGELVRVQQNSSELVCPRITLMHDEEGQFSDVWCDGSGWLKHHDPESRRIDFAARWKKQLRRYRDPKDNLDVIELREAATITQPEEQSGLRAKLIKLWLTQDEKTIAAGTTRTQQNPISGQSVRPVRMLALDNVSVASPTARGTTHRLELWFDEAEKSGSGAATPGSIPRGAAAVEQASLTTPSGPAAPRTTESGSGRDRQEPLQINSDLVQLRVERDRDQDELRVTDIWTEGHVVIHQPHEDGQTPLTITGQKLRLENSGPDSEVVHIHGEPAHIRDRGFHIEGREIHLDRKRNLAWVQGAGLLQLPMKSDLEGQQLDKPQMLDVWWSDQMAFDGRTGRFFGDVRGVLADNRMRCEEMHVLLTEAIDFARGPDADTEKSPEVYSVLCHDGVDFRSFDYDRGRLLEIRHARCAHLSINQVTGQTDASGPGWITLWRRGKGQRAALAPVATATANQPVEKNESEWEYARVDFVGKARGNMHDQLTHFHDEVRIVYGPVDRPLAAIDPENLPPEGLPRAGGILRANHLQMNMRSRPGQQRQHIEMLADGNAFLEGRNFHAQADTISFDESKERYILRSFEPRKATIWRQQAVGGDYSGIEAQRMEFSPNRNELKFDRATGLQGIQ